MLARFCVPVFAIAIFLSSSSAKADDFKVRNGKLVRVSPLEALATQSSEKTETIPGNPPPQTIERPPAKVIGNHLDGAAAASNAVNFGAMLTDANSLDAAKQRAQKATLVVASRNPGKFVSVPITADRPAQIVDGIEGYDAVSIVARNYDVGPPQVFDSSDEMMRAIFGPSVDEIGPSDGQSRPQRAYLVGVQIGENTGTATTRSMQSSDVIRYQSAEAEKQQKIAEDRAKQAQAEADAAKRTADQAKEQAEKAAAADAQKKADDAKNADEERKRKEDEAQQAQARADALKESNEKIAQAEADRDKECAAGTTNKCVLANDRLMQNFDRAEAAQVTALCMAEPDHPIRSGPCAPGAPPCIDCRNGSDLVRQEFSERTIGAALFDATLLAKDRKIRDKELSRRLIKLGNDSFAQ